MSLFRAPFRDALPGYLEELWPEIEGQRLKGSYRPRPFGDFCTCYFENMASGSR